jgi:hypothetical protein
MVLTRGLVAPVCNAIFHTVALLPLGLKHEVPRGKGVLWSLSDGVEKLVSMHSDPHRNQPSG